MSHRNNISNDGYFGAFGGRYSSEVLVPALQELATSFAEIQQDQEFWKVFAAHAKDYIGRPTPLMHAKRASKALGGAQIYIKLEGLANTGAHKINNALGQVLLAQRLGKTRIIAETGAGQHGAATAAMCARFGIPCRIYMGTVDWRRQYPNVYYMEQFGAEVVCVHSGTQTLKDAVNEALRDWAESFESTHYIIGSALGPHPFPTMVREFQSIIGKELVSQLCEKQINPRYIIASVGGGSNAMGIFHPFIHTPNTTQPPLLSEDVLAYFSKINPPTLLGVEAGGNNTGNATRMNNNAPEGIAHGYRSYFLSDADGQLLPTHSIAAGLDYPGIGPELASLGSSGAVQFSSANDQEALDALQFFARHEGVIFALESAHAGAAALKIAPKLSPQESIVIHMSGRGDKDIFIAAPHTQPKAWRSYLSNELGTLDAMIATPRKDTDNG